MPRCPSCNKFASYQGDEEPEVDSLEYDPAASTITGQVRCVKLSSCCSEEVKEMTFDLEIEVDESDIRVALAKSGCAPEDERIDWRVEDDGFTATEESKTTDRHGKKITSPRYWTMLYGYVGSVTLSAHLPDEYDGDDVTIGSYEANDNAPASSFDDLT